MELSIERDLSLLLRRSVYIQLNKICIHFKFRRQCFRYDSQYIFLAHATHSTAYIYIFVLKLSMLVCAHKYNTMHVTFNLDLSSGPQLDGN